MPATKPPRVSTPSETRRAQCLSCPWFTEQRNAGHTAREHVTTNTAHTVVMVKTIQQSFAGADVKAPAMAGRRALPDVPAY